MGAQQTAAGAEVGRRRRKGRCRAGADQDPRL